MAISARSVHAPTTEWLKGLCRGRDEATPGAAIAVAHEGRVLSVACTGLACLEHSVPITQQSIFHLASVSKQVTGRAIAMLVDGAALSLDQRISEFLPELPDYGEQIRIKHLLFHTSGIRDYVSLLRLADDAEPPTTKRLMTLLSSQSALNFVPGTRHSYSGSGYFLLARIISRVSGMSFAEFCNQYLFDPIGMANTFVMSDKESVVTGRAFGYVSRDGRYRNSRPLGVEGAGGVYTNIDDMLLWERSFATGASSQLGNVRTFEQGHTDVGDAVPYAYGWRCGIHRGLRTRHHRGRAIGYDAFYARLPELNVSVIILANSMWPGTAGLSFAIIDECLRGDRALDEPSWRDLDGDPVEPPSAPVAVTNDVAAYEGDYYSDELQCLYRFQLVDGAMSVSCRDDTEGLAYVGSGRFEGHDRRFEFVLDETGRSRLVRVSMTRVAAIQFDRMPNKCTARAGNEIATSPPNASMTM